MAVKRRTSLIRFESLAEGDGGQLDWNPRQLIAAGGRPLADALGRPRSILQAYEDYRDDSPAGQMFSVANPLHEEVDAVVILGPAETWRPAETILAACRQPHFNEYNRGQRGSKPRIYFVDSAADQDTIASLLDRLSVARIGGTVPHHRWALVVLDDALLNDAGFKDAGSSTGPISEYRRRVVDEMIQQVATNSSFDQRTVGEESCRNRLLIVTRPNTELHLRYAGGGCRYLSVLSQSGTADQLVFSATTLLPVALAAIDIMKLLEGAMQVADEFLSEAVRDDAGGSLLGRIVHAVAIAEKRRFRFVTYHQSLLPLAKWCDSMGDAAKPPTTSSAEPDPRAIAGTASDPAEFYLTGGRERMDRIASLSGQLDGPIEQRARSAANASTGVGLLHLPTIDSHGIGQLFQCSIAARLLLDLLPSL